jgi:signal transduction histidine kinase
MQVLQIIDISKDIMYNIANGEKKLLALINATVSHEMRNPLNSIYSQNIKQIQINEKIQELIKDLENQKMKPKKLKKKLERLQKESL